MEPDFSGYATKAHLKCSDGRTITPNAFMHQNQEKVPLVWQHMRNESTNILGHALLEHRDDGVYCYGFFNDTTAGKNAKLVVEHGDVDSLSIYANQLIEKSKIVTHGMIREVSLVIAGANPGARIDYVNIEHADGDIQTLEDEAVIYTGLQLEHNVNESDSDNQDSDNQNENVEHVEDRTVADVFNTLTEEQKNVVYYMIGVAANTNLENAAEHTDLSIKTTFESLTSEQQQVVQFMIGQAIEHAENKNDVDANSNDDEISASHSDNQEGTTMTHNVFEKDASKDSTGPSLSHADVQSIIKNAQRGGSLREAVLQHAASLEHGIDDIDILFPDARNVTGAPEFIKRRTEWVSRVLTGTRHTPFSRIKSMTADLTLDEARAKGYIKGNPKKEEFFRVAKRVTTPQTIYKKQKLDRDDILDITDFDVVVWLKGEMRLMLEEEIARAVLIGDGRDPGDEDKISEENVRPIATDNDLFVTKLYVNLGDASSSAEEVIDSIVRYRRYYRGSGNPVLFMGESLLSDFLLIKDTTGRRIYKTTDDLTAILRVSEIITVEIMDMPSVDVAAIMVNLQDYTIGADKGGEVSMFDDFDIDFNQNKYLIETRISGALTRAKSAVVVRKVGSAATLVDPVAPTWNGTNHTVTVATTTGITYKNRDTGATLTTGSPITLAVDEELVVIAVPASSSYYLASNTADEFRFTYDKGRVDPAF